jgi:hypothetical protein
MRLTLILLAMLAATPVHARSIKPRCDNTHPPVYVLPYPNAPIPKLNNRPAVCRPVERVKLRT